MRSPLLTLLSAALLISCDSESDPGDGGQTGDTGPETTIPLDTDGDGLTDDEEAVYGTDPTLTDTDGDGLDDFTEYGLGTDGTLVDSDADTYTDFDEVAEGTDPMDAESRIYTGYWPYNPDKDAIVGEDLSSTVSQGEIIGRFIGLDQHEEYVDLYDYAGQGKYTLVDVSTSWCTYCQELSKFLTRQSSIFEGYGWDSMVDMIENGEVQWVTILSENLMGRAPSASTVQSWDQNYPHELIPVLADEEQVMPGHVNVYGYPTVLLLDENMQVVYYNRQNYTGAFDEIISLMGQ